MHVFSKLFIPAVLLILVMSCSPASNGELKVGEKCNQINLLSNRENDPEGNQIKEMNLLNKSEKKITFSVRITEKSKDETNNRVETYTLGPGQIENIGCTGKWTKNILKGEEVYINYEYKIIDAVEEK